MVRPDQMRSVRGNQMRGWMRWIMRACGIWPTQALGGLLGRDGRDGGEYYPAVKRDSRMLYWFPSSLRSSLSPETFVESD
jgi:hypothetical protein